MKNKIIYWIATGIVSALMIMSAFAYLTVPEVAENFTTMGFKPFFRIELGIAKLLGAIVLLLPMIPRRVREWAFAGFAITFISGFIAHLAMGDPMSVAIFPIVILGVLILSQTYFYKTYGAK